MDEACCFNVCVYESERKFPLSGWGVRRLPTDPPRFADRTGSVNRPKERVTEELPLQCGWLSDWRLVPGEGADAEGWTYGSEFDSAVHAPNAGAMRVRRRAWQRVFEISPQFDESDVKFPALFKCVIADVHNGHAGPVTYDMIRDSHGVDTDEHDGMPHHGRSRSGSSASDASDSSTSSTSSTASALVFLYLKDEDAPRCMNPRCRRDFGLVVRRHHCRSCGLIFCGRCAPKREAFDHTRVCVTCVTEETTRVKEFNKLSFAVNATVNLEAATRTVLAEDETAAVGTLEEAELMARIDLLRYEESQMLRTEAEIRREAEESVVDRWVARGRVGPRGGAATIKVSEGIGIDPGKNPTTFVTVHHDSNPGKDFRSETVKKSSSPHYNFQAYMLVSDDRLPFVITVHAVGAFNRTRPLAIARLHTNGSDASVTREVSHGSQYTERGVADLSLTAPEGSAPLPGGLMVEWRIDFRDEETVKDVNFCSDCGRMCTACTCDASLVAKRALEAEQRKKDEERSIFLQKQRRLQAEDAKRVAAGLPPLARRSMVTMRRLNHEAEVGLTRRYWGLWRRLQDTRRREREAAAAEKARRLAEAEAEATRLRDIEARRQREAAEKTDLLGQVTAVLKNGAPRDDSSPDAPVLAPLNGSAGASPHEESPMGAHRGRQRGQAKEDMNKCCVVA